MADIVILGAGLTGLSVAYHLEQRGFHDYLIFEKEADIGGLCRTVQQDGFTFDFTGHLLHASDPYFQDLIHNLIGLDFFHTIARRSYIYSQGVYTRYPFQINLHGLPAQTIAECIEGFVQRKQSRKKQLSFHDWVLQQFGVGFGNHFFFPFQSKIFAHDITKITASWTGRFVPSTSLVQIVQGAMADYYTENVGYNAHFLYPKQGGTIAWVKKFAEHIHNPIHTNFCVKSINMAQKTITFSNGHVQPYKQLINTIPLDTFLTTLQEKPTTTLKKAIGKLLCNSVINFNLGIKRPDISDKHWIYFPEHTYPFYRLGFPHNFSDSATPAGHSALYGEFSYLKNSNTNIDATLQESLRLTKKLLVFDDADITTQKIIPISHAYVMYDFWREKYLPRLFERLNQESIYCAGRYGEWKYSSMQEAILDGKKMAELVTVMPASKIWQAPHATNTRAPLKELS